VALGALVLREASGEQEPDRHYMVSVVSAELAALEVRSMPEVWLAILLVLYKQTLIPKLSLS
jgi:hypothetical protein